jgi:hypothetical protein
MERKFGNMPIMIMSKACHLNGKTPAELVNMKEEVSIHACIKAIPNFVAISNASIRY